jgi:uncharacterized protein YjbI with pentapeptide repeats
MSLDELEKLLNEGVSEFKYIEFDKGADLSWIDMRVLERDLYFNNCDMESVVWSSTALSHEHVDKYYTNFHGSMLKGANFFGSMLWRVTFSNTDLTGANFQKAYLSQASFDNANLCFSNFEGATIGHAGFKNADLRHSNLRHLDCSKAHFKGANLRGADLEGTTINVDFSNDVGDMIDDNLNQKVYLTAIRKLCETFAKQIAEDSQFLEHVEWRELEKLLAMVFESLGFSVTLTRETKDGGKDIVLECNYCGDAKRFYVEIKHWKSHKKLNQKHLQHFVNIVLLDEVDTGLILSTSGYVEGAYQGLSIIEQNRLELGGKERVYHYCKTYVKSINGLWTPPSNLADILFSEEI